MTNRITLKDLEHSVVSLNTLTNQPLKYYNEEEKKANIGHYHLDFAYGGVRLVQTVTVDGAIKVISTCGYGTKKELYNQISMMLNLLQSKVA